MIRTLSTQFPLHDVDRPAYDSFSMSFRSTESPTGCKPAPRVIMHKAASMTAQFRQPTFRHPFLILVNHVSGICR